MCVCVCVRMCVCYETMYESILVSLPLYFSFLMFIEYHFPFLPIFLSYI